MTSLQVNCSLAKVNASVFIAGEKSSPQETKCSIGFSANIADMRIPFQSFVIVTPRYLILSTFSRTAPSKV